MSPHGKAKTQNQNTIYNSLVAAHSPPWVSAATVPAHLVNIPLVCLLLIVQCRHQETQSTYKAN